MSMIFFGGEIDWDEERDDEDEENEGEKENGC